MDVWFYGGKRMLSTALPWSMFYYLKGKKNNPRARSIFPLDCVVMENRKQVGPGRVFFMTFRLFLRRRHEMNLCFALTVNLI